MLDVCTSGAEKTGLPLNFGSFFFVSRGIPQVSYLACRRILTPHTHTYIHTHTHTCTHAPHTCTTHTPYAHHTATSCATPVSSTVSSRLKRVSPMVCAGAGVSAARHSLDAAKNSLCWIRNVFSPQHQRCWDQKCSDQNTSRIHISRHFDFTMV